MTFPRCTGYAFLFLTFLCCSAQKVSAQNADAMALVSVSLQIIGKGTVGTINQETGYFTMATVTNQQDTPIVFWIMSCGCPVENWVTKTRSTHRLLE